MPTIENNSRKTKQRPTSVALTSWSGNLDDDKAPAPEQVMNVASFLPEKVYWSYMEYYGLKVFAKHPEKLEELVNSNVKSAVVRELNALVPKKFRYQKSSRVPWYTGLKFQKFLCTMLRDLQRAKNARKRPAPAIRQFDAEEHSRELRVEEAKERAEQAKLANFRTLESSLPPDVQQNLAMAPLNEEFPNVQQALAQAGVGSVEMDELRTEVQKSLSPQIKLELGDVTILVTNPYNILHQLINQLNEPLQVAGVMQECLARIVEMNKRNTIA